MTKHIQLPVDEDYLTRSTEKLADYLAKPSYQRISDRIQAIHEQTLRSLAVKCKELAQRHSLYTNEQLALEAQKLAQQLRITPPTGTRSHLVGWLKGVHFAITGESDNDQISERLRVLSGSKPSE